MILPELVERLGIELPSSQAIISDGAEH